MRTVYPKKYAHGFIVLCFVVVMQSFIMNPREIFIDIHQGCFAGTGAIVRLPQCQWNKPDGYGEISQCITTTKHSKAKTVCIFLGIYCITRSRSPITKFYTLGGQILEQVNQAKYLGVMLSDELNWSPHINSVTTSANSTLGFIRRNLKQCPKDLKGLAYLSLVRSKLEYAASVWDPHHTPDTNKLEQVQRRAARFVCNNYSPYSSVTQMLSDLGWQQLKDRRKHIRLALFYKIVHHLIAVPHEDILRKADSRTISSHNYKYRSLRSYKDPYKFSFSPGLYWNGIPCQRI